MRAAAWVIAGVALAAIVWAVWRPLPQPAPVPAAPAAADEAGLNDIELLGKRLFEDRNLSDPAGVACASCHVPGQAFQGNNGSKVPALAQGSHAGIMGTRNTPSLMYARYAPAFHFEAEKNEQGEVEQTPTGGQFLDGRADDFVAQIDGPMFGPREMGAGSKDKIVARVKDSSYADLARKAYGNDVFDRPDAFAQLAAAIAAFEMTDRFAPFSSKFDQVLRGQAQFTEQEAHGFALFKDPQKGNCLACHVGKEGAKDPQDWLFTDFTYDALGAPRNTDIPDTAAVDYYDLGLCDQPGIEKKLPQGVEKDSLCGAFKVPTLRNIAVTGPYLHNGVFKSLRDVVKFYVTRDTDPALWYPQDASGKPQKFNDLPAKYHANVNTAEIPYDRKPGQQPRLTEAEIDDLVAFLNTLTDRAFVKQP